MKLHLLQLSLEWIPHLSSPSYFESHAFVFYHLLFLLVSVPSISLWNIVMITLLKTFCISFIIFLLMMGHNFLFLYSVQSNLSIVLKCLRIFMMLHEQQSYPAALALPILEILKSGISFSTPAMKVLDGIFFQFKAVLSTLKICYFM